MCPKENGSFGDDFPGQQGAVSLHDPTLGPSSGDSGPEHGIPLLQMEWGSDVLA